MEVDYSILKIYNKLTTNIDTKVKKKLYSQREVTILQKVFKAIIL